MPDADGRTTLPIACTLDGESGPVRVARWRALIDAAGLGSQLNGDRLEVRFRAAPGVAAELSELVDAERVCCAFLGWNVEPSDSDLLLTVTGDHDQLALLGCLGGAGPS
jgi:hypothetical protein